MPDGEAEIGAKRDARSPVLDRRPEYERLGRWLRERREAASLQQKPISRAVGKPEQFLNKVEHGRQRIDVVEFVDLCVALGLDRAVTIGEIAEIIGTPPGGGEAPAAES